MDVILCSTLDEQTSSQFKVGFQLFSFIVEDWRHYVDTHSILMKYCAICALLSEAGDQGKNVVDNHIPAKQVLDKSFLNYLRQKLDGDFGGPAKKISSASLVIQNIRPNVIKSISRHRLVVVSSRDISGSSREHSHSSDSSSSTVNLPYRDGERKEISSSGYPAEDPMNQLLEGLGLGANFCLDIVGEHREDMEHNDDEYMMDFDEDHGVGVVSSSTRRRHRSSTTTSSENVKIEDESLESVNEEANESDDVDLGMDADQYLCKQLDKKIKEKTDELQRRMKLKHKHEESEFESEEGNGDATLTSKTQRRMSSPVAKAPVKKMFDEEDSDLEVVSVVEVDNVDMKDKVASECSDDSASRDEEEAESGEDVVPNYDEDSDVDVGGNAVARGGAKTRSSASPEKNVTNTKDDDDNTVDKDQSMDSADDCSSSLTLKLRSSPVKSEKKREPLAEYSRTSGDEAAENEGFEASSQEIDYTELIESPSPSLRSPRRTQSKSPTASPSKRVISSPGSSQTLPVSSPAQSEVESKDGDNPTKRAKIESEENDNDNKAEDKEDENDNNDSKSGSEIGSPLKEEQFRKSTRQTATRGRMSIRSTPRAPATPTVSTPSITTRRTTRSAAAQLALQTPDVIVDYKSDSEHAEEEEESEASVSTSVKRGTRSASTRGRRGRGRPKSTRQK